MTRSEAIAHLLNQPEDTTAFLVCVTPAKIADMLERAAPKFAARHPRDLILSEAANAIEDYAAANYPSFDDEVGIGNDILSNTEASLLNRL